MSRVIKALVLVCVLVQATAAQPVTAQDRKKAAAHWKQGKAFYDAKQWDHAMIEYRAAWELTREPELLFSIALALHKKGDLAAALEQYKQYVASAPNGSAVDEAREYIATLTAEVERNNREAAQQLEAERLEREQAEAAKAKLAADAAAEADRKEREGEAARSAERKRAAEQARQAELERTRRNEQADAQARRARMIRFSGLAVAAAGVVSLGIGIKYGLDASSASDALSAHTAGAWTDELLARQEEGRSAETKMIVLTAVGGGLVISGAIAYVVGTRVGNRSEQARVVVTPGPGAAGVGLATRF